MATQSAEPGRSTTRPGSPGIGNRLRHALGFRQSFVVHGVRYREVSTEPIRHALSRKGAGHKEFDVIFPDGGTMRISATARREYADLGRPRLLGVYRRLEHRLLPGMRVLILEGGTGYAGAWAAGLVAPSGAVVSLDRDPQCAAYAQKRYRLPNAGFEVGGPEALAGETEGAFSAILAVDAIGPEEDEAAILAELWRLVAPGGWLMIAGTSGPRTDSLVGRLSAIGRPPGEGPGDPVTLVGDGRDGWTLALVERPRID
jgi:SAM-dependent methyltransferase